MPLWYSKPRQSILLTWTASTSQVQIYTIYRSLVSGGPYTPLTTVDQSQTQYEDVQVNPGTTYFYVVTDTDNTGAESDPSPEVQATTRIP